MLRRHRRLKLFLSLGRTLAISGFLGGLVWATTRPIWVLRESNQIIIEGNQLLSEQAIKSLLPLSYPQSLLRIEPEAIARSLESQATIADATVTRQLFPPGITVQIKERVPVAIALTNLPKGSSTATSKASVGLLDQNGVWIPIQSYASQTSTVKLPNLKVIGLPEQYRPYWPQVYQAVSRSPIKVFEIDCQDPTNLILKTELGIVHLGPYSPRLTEQLTVLDQMRQLTAQLKSSQIAYINLKNPEIPSVQMNQTKELVKPDKP
jgi:cell division protein FtsQ